MSLRARATPRKFLKVSAAAAAAVAVGPTILGGEDKAGTKLPVVGSGEHAYECVHGWGELPKHVKWGETHGVAVASEFGRGFITDGAQGKVIIFDLKTLKVTGEAKADKDADSVAYDPASKRIFVMNGDPHSSTVIDAKSGDVVGTIELGGGPEFAVADGKGTVFVNMEDKNEVVAIDSSTLKIKSRWPLAPAGTPTALAMDTAHRRLFSAGRNPQNLVVLDADSGKVIQSFPISVGVDAAVFEPETGMLYVSTREGFVHIFHQDTLDKYSEVEKVKTEFGAKTMGLDTKTHTIFVDTADFGPAPAPTAERPHPQPAPVLGTFHVLVYGK